MNAALASDNPRLRKSAVRAFLDGRPELRIDFILPDNATTGQRLLVEQFQALRLPNVKVDVQRDIISFYERRNRPNENWSGHLVEDGFDITYKRWLKCVGSCV